MSKFRLALSLFLLFVSVQTAVAVSVPELDSLDRYIGLKKMFEGRKYARIDKEKRAVASRPSFSSYMKLGKEYTLFKADSAIFYYDKAAELASSPADSLLVRMKKVRSEVIAGYYAEAYSDFKAISHMEIPDTLLPEFYESGYRIYSFSLNGSTEGGLFYDRYYSNTVAFRKKWIESLPVSSNTRRLYEAEQAMADGKQAVAKMILVDMIPSLRRDGNDFALACAFLAKIYRSEGKLEESVRYFALSAISDIMCAVKENQSILDLSMILYGEGDIDRAYCYIFTSLEDAAFCNAQMRVYNVSGLLPVIESQHREEVAEHERMLMMYIVVSFFLLIGLAVAVFYLVKQMKKLTRTRLKLKEANMTKDEYMGQFLELCSIYMKRLDSFTKLVNRKLVSGQVDDLVKMMKSQKFSDEQHSTFYKEFDNAFLKIYTTFVDDVNALLRPEERFEIEAPGSLNTELRIYALLRLGIVDSSKIAEFLRYSVNTIYAYRNKMKNRAIDRDSFEKNVMKIGIID